MLPVELGELLGFLGKTSDVRVAQYETEARTPKADLIKKMAQIFDISPRAINVPDIDSYLGLMHPLCTGRYVWNQNRRNRRRTLSPP